MSNFDEMVLIHFNCMLKPKVTFVTGYNARWTNMNKQWMTVYVLTNIIEDEKML